MRVRMRPSLSFLFFLLCAPAGCALQDFHPRAPHVSHEGSVSFEITRVRFEPGMVFTFARLDAPPGTVLEVVRLTPRSVEPCADGARAEEIEVDDIRYDHDPLTPGGSHDVRLEFDAEKANEILGRASAVDVQLSGPDGGHCVRTLLAGPDVAEGWRLSRTLFLGTAVAGDLPLARAGDRGPALSLAERVGTWFGPYKGWLELGAAGAVCKACPDPTNTLVMLPEVALAADRYWTHSGSWALGTQVGYQITAAGPERKGQPVHFDRVLHGPRVALELALTGKRELRPGFSGSDRMIWSHLEVPLSFWMASGSGSKVGASIGLVLSYGLGL